jgi:CRISPR-associated protein Csd1
VPFVAHLERADPLQVRDFLKSVWGSRPKPIDTSPFYAALLRIPAQGRFSVHSWLTETLGDAETNLRAYFNAITLGTDVDETPGIWRLAVATVPRTKRKAVVPAATAVALFHAALFGASVPHRAFGQAVARQRTELAGEDHADKEFRLRLAARTALLKLYYATNKGVHMTAENHEGENHPAYLCGRLLALLDKIHNEAHDNKSASSPAARYYGAASKTPALVFPQLCTLARYHLDKIGRGWAHNLEHGVSAEKRKDGVSEDFEGLAAVCARLKGAAGGSFPRILSLEEQGRFAIGFYFERVRKWPRSSDSPTTKEGKED